MTAALESSSATRLTAVVVANGLEGLRECFPCYGIPAAAGGQTLQVDYRFQEVEAGFRLDLTGADLLIVPNGSDHVAMLGVRDQVRAFLDAGGAVFCFDGWFTDWVPGHRWRHDNSKATRDIRYRVATDRHGLFDGIDLDPFIFHHGISGWWACGAIEPAGGADVLLEDTWGRAMVVLDETTTPGLLALTASGPLAGALTDDVGGPALVPLYHRLLHRVAAHRARLDHCPGDQVPSRPARDGASDTDPSARINHDARIGVLFNGVWSQYAFATAPKYRGLYDLVYVHDLSYERIRHLDALVVPFQSHQPAITARREAIYRFLADGKKVAVFGDSDSDWIDATWESRPVDNYWWVTDPTSPPISDTDYSHPVYTGLIPRHACWHVHGVYTQVPAEARVIQRNEEGESITWQTEAHGGVLFASTLDPIVEHGIQQIRHLDNYCDRLTAWLCGTTPGGAFALDPAVYGVDRLAL